MQRHDFARRSYLTLFAGLSFCFALIQPLVADSLSSLPDPNYAHLPSGALSGPIDGPIDRVVYPTIGFPSIVSHSDTVTILFRMAHQRSVRFRVRLTRTCGPVHNKTLLPVRRAVFDPSWGGYQILATVPPGTPEDMYDLTVETGPLGISDRQPNAVRVLRTIPTSFRFIHLADSQYGDHRGIKDPGNLNAGSYGPREILKQELEEIRFLDPAFCVLSGDLLYGVNYEAEYRGAHEDWRTAGFPVFMVPGNHDGYATTRNYRLGWFRYRKRDGLEYWRRHFGPLYYSFDFGRYHFVAVNSYDGPPSRRDGVLATAMNYGGHIDPPQMAWLRRDLAAATAAGKQTIVFMHHNPQGHISRKIGQRYMPSLPFTIKTIAPALYQYLRTGKNPRSGQAWNEKSSGQAFLKLVGQNSVSHVLLGHVHHDRVSKVGNVEFIETTSLASSTSKYWGYRLFEVANGTVRSVDYEGSKRQSIPAGNLVIESASRNDGSRSKVTLEVANGLSRPVEGTLHFHLRWSPGGYKTSAGQILETTRVGNRAIVKVRIRCPAGTSFTSPSRTRVEVEGQGKPARPGCGAMLSPGNTPSAGGGDAILSFLLFFLLLPLLIWASGRTGAGRRVALTS